VAGSSTPEDQQPKMLGCQQWNRGTVNRRLDEAVAAGRAKSSATWKVGNLSERDKVYIRRCTAVEDTEFAKGGGPSRSLTLPFPSTFLYPSPSP